MTESLRKMEFCHTVLHNKNFKDLVKQNSILNGNNIKKNDDKLKEKENGDKLI